MRVNTRYINSNRGTSLISLMVSVDVKHHVYLLTSSKSSELKKGSPKDLKSRFGIFRSFSLIDFILMGQSKQMKPFLVDPPPFQDISAGFIFTAKKELFYNKITKTMKSFGFQLALFCRLTNQFIK